MEMVPAILNNRRVRLKYVKLLTSMFCWTTLLDIGCCLVWMLSLDISRSRCIQATTNLKRFEKLSSLCTLWSDMDKII